MVEADSVEEVRRAFGIKPGQSEIRVGDGEAVRRSQEVAGRFNNKKNVVPGTRVDGSVAPAYKRRESEVKSSRQKMREESEAERRISDRRVVLSESNSANISIPKARTREEIRKDNLNNIPAQREPKEFSDLVVESRYQQSMLRSQKSSAEEFLTMRGGVNTVTPTTPQPSKDRGSKNVSGLLFSDSIVSKTSVGGFSSVRGGEGLEVRSSNTPNKFIIGSQATKATKATLSPVKSEFVDSEGNTTLPGVKEIKKQRRDRVVKAFTNTFPVIDVLVNSHADLKLFDPRLVSETNPGVTEDGEVVVERKGVLVKTGTNKEEFKQFRQAALINQAFALTGAMAGFSARASPDLTFTEPATVTSRTSGVQRGTFSRMTETLVRGDAGGSKPQFFVVEGASTIKEFTNRGFVGGGGVVKVRDATFPETLNVRSSTPNPSRTVKVNINEVSANKGGSITDIQVSDGGRVVDRRVYTSRNVARTIGDESSLGVVTNKGRTTKGFVSEGVRVEIGESPEINVRTRIVEESVKTSKARKEAEILQRKVEKSQEEIITINKKGLSKDNQGSISSSKIKLRPEPTLNKVRSGEITFQATRAGAEVLVGRTSKFSPKVVTPGVVAPGFLGGSDTSVLQSPNHIRGFLFGNAPRKDIVTIPDQSFKFKPDVIQKQEPDQSYFLDTPQDFFPDRPVPTITNTPRVFTPEPSHNPGLPPDLPLLFDGLGGFPSGSGKNIRKGKNIPKGFKPGLKSLAFGFIGKKPNRNTVYSGFEERPIPIGLKSRGGLRGFL